MAWKAPIYLIAAGLGVEVEEVRGSLDRRAHRQGHRGRVRNHPGGHVRCGVHPRRGVVNGREAIVIEHIIRMARDVAPDWPTSEFDATYRVDIEGDPDIHCALNARRGRGPRRGSRGDGGHRDAGRQRDPVRGRRARGSAQLARHADDVAAARIRLMPVRVS